MNSNGLNANKVSVDASLSNGLIGKAIKNNKGLNSDTLEKILYTYKDLNPEWLMTGEGKMLKKQKETSVSEPTTSYGSAKSDRELLELQRKLIVSYEDKIEFLEKQIKNLQSQKKYENHN